MTVMMSLVGMVVLLAIAFFASNNRKAIQLRTVLGAFVIQLFFGAIVLYTPFGKSALLGVSRGVQRVIDYGNDGISFIFGGLNSDQMFELFGGSGFVFAIRVTGYHLLFILDCRFVPHWIDAIGHQHLGRSSAENSGNVTGGIAFSDGQYFCRSDRGAFGRPTFH